MEESGRTERSAVRHAALRREKCRARAALGEAKRAEQNGAICQKLFELPQYREAERLLVYVSYGAEVSTRRVIAAALKEKKKVYCPRVEGERIAFYRIGSLVDLKTGFRGILEPEGKTERFDTAGPDCRRRTLILIPGTAFDLSGHRIGYGGGYYDRFLAEFAEGDRPFCVGLCFSCQLAQIEPCAHDQAVDLVLYSEGG